MAGYSPFLRNAVQSVQVIALCTVLTSCGNSSDNEEPLQDDQQKLVIGNDGPEGDSGLSIDDAVHPLDVALGDIWGVNNEHFRIDFTLSNGNFRLATETFDGQTFQTLVPAEATAVFHMHMFSPGSSFDYASYAYAADADDGSLYQGMGFFTEAYVGIDSDMDGEVNSEENFAVIDGTVDFTGTMPDIELSFSVTLSNGVSVTGIYEGLFDFTER